MIETASYDQNKIIELAARVELGSKHPLAAAIVQKAKDLGIQIVSAENIKSETGVGISGMVDGKSVRVEACSDSPMSPLKQGISASISFMKTENE